MTLYEKFKKMTIDEMAEELASVIKWKRRYVRYAKKHPQGLVGAIKMILEDKAK